MSLPLLRAQFSGIAVLLIAGLQVIILYEIIALFCPV